MAKTLISRLDAENIVRAAVDPDTHEATGDVYDSVNDVSYPFGGGGSDFKNPVITLSIVLTGTDHADVGIYNLEDGYFFQSYETVTADSTIQSYTDGMDMNGDTVYVLQTSVPVAQVSDLVNCTAEDMGGGFAGLVVTDPTQPASATLTYVGSN